jgi:hypothetical protein
MSSSSGLLAPLIAYYGDSGALIGRLQEATASVLPLVGEVALEFLFHSKRSARVNAVQLALRCGIPLRAVRE